MFRAPCNILVVGPTSSGKTVFTRRLITYKDEMFDPPPKTVHYCYGAWQPAFERMRNVHFHEGLPVQGKIWMRGLRVERDCWCWTT